MKKHLSKILIAVVMVAIFVAPISAGFKINEIKAQGSADARSDYNQEKLAEEEGKDTDTQDNYSLASSCGIGFWGNSSIGGCIAGLLYILWSVSALLAEFAGKFLDFFIYYSTNSSSYANEFVSNAWGAVRDIANIFFIIALLYVAIKTILGLNVTDNKKLVGSVIIIALIINFSLFTSKIVIDASNILAKVFYNNITSIDGSKKDANGNYTTVKEAEEEGQKSISVGIISKYNPQTILNKDAYEAEGGTRKFIFLTLILLLVTLYTAYIFFSVALLFVARVVSLWIAMIFSPLAFASYTVPFEIPGFGHKEWWPDLMKNAFLAPLFVFMLYIIISFSNHLKGLGDGPFSSDPMQYLMKVVIPFAIIAMLLMKAKTLAVKFSGEMGEAVSKLGSAVGGLALGAATGGAAWAGRASLGKMGMNIANNDELKEKALAGNKWAKMQLGLGNALSKSSFDTRQTGLGKQFAKGTGLNLDRGLGFGGTDIKSTKGGAKEAFEREAEKRRQKIKTYEMSGAAAAEQDKLADKAKIQNERAEQYKKDKDIAQERMEGEGGAPFNEAEFKANYERGGRIAVLGKNVEGGSVEKVNVETSKDINVVRREKFIVNVKANPELAAAIRKGKNKKDHLLHELGELVNEEHGGEHEHKEEHKEEAHGEKEHKEEVHHEAAHASEADHSHTPASSSGGKHH